MAPCKAQFSPDFHCFAPVGPGRVGLGVNRDGGEKQPGKACNEHSKSDLKGPGFSRIFVSGGPRRAVRMYGHAPTRVQAQCQSRNLEHID